MAEVKVPIQVNLPDNWIELIVDRLRSDPEAKWVEIIRCKDCKWSKKYVPMHKTYYYCREAGVYGRTEDDFCSRAERREKGDE